MGWAALLPPGLLAQPESVWLCWLASCSTLSLPAVCSPGLSPQPTDGASQTACWAGGSGRDGEAAPGEDSPTCSSRHVSTSNGSFCGGEGAASSRAMREDAPVGPPTADGQREAVGQCLLAGAAADTQAREHAAAVAQEQVQQLQEEVASLRRQLAEQAAAATAALAVAEAAAAEERLALQQDAAAAQAALQAMSQQLQAAQAQLVQAEDELESERRQVAAAQRQVADLTARLGHARVMSALDASLAGRQVSMLLGLRQAGGGGLSKGGGVSLLAPCDSQAM